MVLEKGEEGPLWKAVRSLSRDEAVFAYRVPKEVVDPEAPGMARQLAEREHWEGQSRWVLFNPSGRMVFCSQEVPTLKAVLQAFQDSGLMPFRQRLEAFLKANPERQDALLDLCTWEATLASRRLSPLLNPPKEGDGGALPTLKGEGPEPVALLRDEEDARVFSDYGAVLAKVMESGAWMTGDGRFLSRALPPGGYLSPTLRMDAGRYLAQVEEALRRHPNLQEVWQVWIQLAGWAGRKDLQGFIETIEPLPGDEAFPPDALTRALVGVLKQRQDWPGIMSLLAPVWGRWQRTRIDVVGGGDAGKRYVLSAPWSTTVQPMLEAMLRLGETSKAQQFLEQVHTWLGAPAFARQAADLAQACHQPSLAERWKTLAAAQVQP